MASSFLRIFIRERESRRFAAKPRQRKKERIVSKSAGKRSVFTASKARRVHDDSADDGADDAVAAADDDGDDDDAALT